MEGRFHSGAKIPKSGWRHSLYARAALFLLLGSGSLLGAVVVWSSTIVEESVDRLLDERIDLARAVGNFLESRVRSDMERLASNLRPLLTNGEPSEVALREALARDYRGTLFTEGAFVLDPSGDLLAAVPDSPEAALRSVDSLALRTRALRRNTAVSSPLVTARSVPVLVLVAPLKGRGDRLLGFVGGLLQPSATSLLGPMLPGEAESTIRLELVDQRGVVISSTHAEGLYRLSDHGNVLAGAIASNRELRGRCHTCHAPAGGPGELTTTDVLAFAPLPALDLGLAVHQAEAEALAPAFSLRRRLRLIGLAFVALFVMFAGLSVRSVVRPIKGLTRRVHRAEAGGRMALGFYGRDEVGQLATALEFYHARMIESLADAETSREALRRETEATRRHLETLQEIAAESTQGQTLSALAEHAVDRLTGLHDVASGALRIRYHSRRAEARHNLMADEAVHLMRVADRLLSEPPKSPRSRSGSGARVVGPPAALPDTERGAEPEPGRPASLTGPHRITVVDATALGASSGHFVVAALETQQGVRVTAAVESDDAPEVAQRERLVSLLHHIGMSATNLLLRELNVERRRLQGWYLQRVLRAQEDERRRIARELHDTLAQDLAALRLEIERLGAHPEAEGVGQRLGDLERRAHDMLTTVRQIMLDLRLQALDSMGFLPALQDYVERVERDSELRLTFEIAGDERELDYDTSVTLFRIVQESLQNAVQHAGAEHVMLTVTFGADRVELTIEDDGGGFDLDAVRRRGAREQRGLGLVGMEERARLLGGSLSISTGADEGTTVHISVPIPPDAAGSPAQTPPVESS